ncbi:MAG: methylated-DNA--[protein]-cysteine S-methyltransferase [Methylotenera sp.]|nr:methylated-DNA--[protein]-cysteine S-methyltransferase [Methylotenera sp.]MDD4925105.1 methylated-DNA--[protein]-cysteine S-methyltransferase [Methylotenera sp.]
MSITTVSFNDNALINTPFGAVVIAVYEGQLAIELLPASVQIEKESTHFLVKLASEQIKQYLQQPKARFELPLAQQGSAFQQRVWQAIAAIPSGQTRTYGELAVQIGSGPRAVANACGANQLPLVIPCHRVVAKNGIGGFMQGKANGLGIKQWLLQHEGVNGFGGE